MRRTYVELSYGLSVLAVALGACSVDGNNSPSEEGSAFANPARPAEGGATSTDAAAGQGLATSSQAPKGQDGGGADCPNGCPAAKTGAGTSDPFTPGAANGSQNVKVDSSGALVLDRSATVGPSVIWIANTAENTVSKVDTTTFKELGRYRTGSGDPSRTSVDSLSDAYVGNRNGHSLTKVSAAGVKCPDRDGNGTVSTSAGLRDVLAPGKDECVLWETPLGGDIRGVAAQDIYVETKEDPELPAQLQMKRYVWAGGMHGNIYKLDGETGKVLLTTSAPCPVYGFALDGAGQLWMTSGSCLGRLDTNKCVDAASCAALACQTQCSGSGNPVSCADTCDTATKQKIQLPDSTYGITVDYKQRVWLGGGKGLKRYNPSAPAAQRLMTSVNGFSHGVAADSKGWIWGAAKPSLVRLNGDTMQSLTITLPDSKGMAVDRDGKIWIIGSGSSAHVVVPGPGINDNTVKVDAVVNLGNPYTYSDMTGQQAALAKRDPGHYREAFPGCAQGDTSWLSLDFDVETPAGTSVLFRVRTAATAQALAGAKWIGATTVPPGKSPVALPPLFKAAGIAPQHFLDVEVWLSVIVADPTGVLTPKVKTFGVTHTCPSDVTPPR